MFKIYKNKGFALLFAILLSGAVLTIGIILMNIITKQLVFSSLSKESEITYYYLANSGRECLSLQKNNFRYSDGLEYFPIQEDVTVNCLDKDIVLSYSSGQGFVTYTKENIEFDGKFLSFKVQVNSACLNGEEVGCDNNNGEDEIIDRYSYVMIVEGYSGESGANRTVKRTAVYVEKPPVSVD